MQSTTDAMSNQQPSHQFASAASEQIGHYIPAYATPSSSRSPNPSPQINRNGLASLYHRTETDNNVREAHELIIRQQPEHGKVFIGKEKGKSSFYDALSI